ncbi:MAG: hypothetical protein GC155_02235 [Alphaproteobacteria bacterium]|nr:hypothetical protein [Alphaproteobacteria bacterium]
MIADAAKQRFQTLAQTGDADPALLARLTKQGDLTAAADLAALLARVAFIEPEQIRQAYDAAAAGWFGEASPAMTLLEGSGTGSPDLWAPFWDFIDDDARTDAGAFTTRTASLGAFVDDGFAGRAGRASLTYAGVADAVRQGWPDRFRLEDLAACPPGSLGAAFHSLIVDNDFDLEVLDRDALGLANLPPPLDYLNVRILQCHDLWHIVGGYQTTALHEVAISAFQLSQFGHNYSAQFLCVVTTKAAIKRPEGLPLLLEIILSAWRHGRGSPQLLGVAWPDVWQDPTEIVRKRLGVEPYQSPFPPDLVEQLERAQATA